MVFNRTGSARGWVLALVVAILGVAGGVTAWVLSRPTAPVEPSAWTAGLVGISNLHGDVLPCT